MAKSRYRVVKVDTSDEEVSAAILEMDAMCFPDDAPEELHGDWWVAYAGKTPVAYAGLHESTREYGAAYLCRAGVLPVARGHGLQRRLIKVRERGAKLKGLNACVSYTHPHNAHSINNLIACGFRAFKPSVVFKDAAWCYWRKTIETGAL